MEEYFMIEYYKLSDLARERRIPKSVPSSELVLATGIKTLDELQRHWSPGVYSISGAPGVGKTTFAVYISRVLGQSNQKSKVIYATGQPAEIILEKTLLSDVYHLNPDDAITHKEYVEGYTSDTLEDVIEYNKDSPEEFLVCESDNNIKEFLSSLTENNYIIVWDVGLFLEESLWHLARRWAYKTSSLVFIITSIPKPFRNKNLEEMNYNGYVSNGVDVKLELQHYKVDNPNFTTSVVLEDKTIVDSVHLWKLYCKYNRFGEKYSTQIAWKPEVWTILSSVKMTNKWNADSRYEVYTADRYKRDLEIQEYTKRNIQFMQERREAEAKQAEMEIVGCFGKSFDRTSDTCISCAAMGDCQKKFINFHKREEMQKEVVTPDTDIYRFNKSVRVVSYKNKLYICRIDLENIIGDSFIDRCSCEHIRIHIRSSYVVFLSIDDVLKGIEQSLSNKNIPETTQCKRTHIAEWITHTIIPTFDKTLT